jgi:putative membrane protein
MSTLSAVLTGLVAFLHLFFMVLEMFLWTKPYGLKTFGNSLEKAQATAPLAMNQGLYNGFLAAGLVWSLVAPAMLVGPVRIFFLVCVVIAGAFGGMTAKRSILLFQALPGAAALVVTVLA